MLQDLHRYALLATPLATLALASALLPGAALARQESGGDEPTLVRWYDVRGLMVAFRREEPRVDLRPSLAASRLHSLEPDHDDVELETTFSLAEEGIGDVLADLLAELDAAGEFDVDERSGRLRVSGTARVQAEATRLLADLSAFAFDRVEVEMLRLPAGYWPAEGRAALSAEEADALLSGVEATVVARREVPIGRVAALGSETIESYLYDYDVEVAQGAVAADPSVSILRTGAAMGVLVRRSTDGRLLVNAWGRQGALERPISEVKVDALAGARIQVPRMATSLWTASATLAPGGALVAGEDSSGLGARLLRVRAVESAISGPDGGPDGGPVAASDRFVPLGECVAAPVRHAPHSPSFVQPSGGWHDSHEWSDWLAELDALLDPSEIADRGMELRDELGLRDRIRQLGDVLYLPDDGPLRARVRDYVGELSAAFAAETFEIDVRVGDVAAAELRALLDGPREQLVVRLRSRAGGAVRSGDSLSILGGHESSYLHDYDVEIAQAAAISDPISSTHFEGVSLWCAPFRGPGGGVTAALELTVHVPNEGTRPFDVAIWHPRPQADPEKPAQPIGAFALDAEVELGVTRRARTRTTIHAKDGAWTLAAASRLGDTDRVLVAMARISGRIR